MFGWAAKLNNIRSGWTARSKIFKIFFIFILYLKKIITNMLQNTVQYANKYKNLLFQLVYCREYLFYEKFDTCMCALVSIVQN